MDPGDLLRQLVCPGTARQRPALGQRLDTLFEVKGNAPGTLDEELLARWNMSLE